MTNSSLPAKSDRWLKKPIALLILVSIHIILSIINTQYKDANGDEHGHLSYAARCVRGNAERISKWDDSKTSVMAVALIPRIFSQLMNPGLKKTDGGKSDIMNGRYVVLICSIVLLIYLWLLLKKLNLPYSMLVFPFAVIDPLWLTYATLVISDLLVGLFSTALLYHVWEYYNHRKKKDLALASLVAGLGIVCKFSFIPILLGLGLAIFILFIKQIRKGENIFLLLKMSVIATFLTFLTINCCYPFDQRFTSLKDNSNKGECFKSLSNKWIGSLPLPVPQNMIQAADLLNFHSQADISENDRTFSGGTYLFNAFHKDEGPIWYYYWILLAVKTPLFLLTLFLTGIASIFFSIQQHKLAFLASFTFIFYFFYGGLFNPFQIGARHILAVYPLLFITAGYAIYRLSQWLPPALFSISMVTGSAWMLFSIGYYFPHLLPYTNELISEKRIAHWYIDEGAIDYGQSEEFAENFLKNNPEYRYPHGDAKQKGKFAITMGSLFTAAWVRNDPKAMELWKKKPDEIKRFVLLIYNEDK